MKKVVLGFGRMNPSTTGHEVVASKIAAEAKKRNAEARLYLSHTTNPKKDPLPYADKVKFATAAFKHLVKVINSPARTIIEVAIELEREGVTEMTVVVGEDRVKEFNNLLTKYNGKDFTFDKIEVIKAGDRDPDADDVTGMSASKMRKLASEGDFEAFAKGAPSKLSKAMVKQMYDKVRKNMRIVEQFDEACWAGYKQNGMKKKGDRMVPNCVPEENEVEESVLSLAQRRARGMRLRRMQKRIQRARMLQMKRTADPARLMRRAKKAAYKMFRTRLSGGKDYASLGASEKIGVDRRLQKLLPVIKKFATRLIPQVRRKEQMRKRSMMQHQNESFTKFMLERTKTPQDSDIKGKAGTQPAKYHAGLSKSTKEKRDAHFKKMGPRADDDKSAYVDAPGDKEAREKDMPQSKHTEKYKRMFGEALDKKDMQRLDMLVRMGLADKKYLALIKRSIGKLDSGETMTPQERQASFNLLQTLLDMTLSTDAIFRMTRSQVQKDKNAKVNEDLGIGRALSPFTHAGEYRKAKATLKDLMARKKDSTKSLGYYATQVAKQFSGVDARKLMAMMTEDSDWEERDGLEMAQIEVANMAQDVEELAELLDMMEEEPEAWVLSKITKAADYIESVKNYLEFEDDFDDEEDDEDEDEMDDVDLETEIFNMMQEDGILDEEFKEIFEEIDGLKKKAEKSGIPYGILKKVYDRGMAAWQGGHRPGTTAQQWAFARVNSFITKGKGTWGGADSDLASKVKKNEEFSAQFSEAQEIGTDAMRIAYARMTPGQNIDLVTAKYETDKVLNVLNDIRTQRAKKLFDEQKDVIKEAIEMHVEKKIPFAENVFRVGSENYFEFFRQARELHESGVVTFEGENKYLLEETDIGLFAEYEGQHVPLDCPMYEEEINEEGEEGKDPPLNKPKRGGPKKFYVYVRKPDGGIKKVTWGDTTGLSVKMNDPEARKSFAARHQCSTQKDRTSAAYWACNTPRYAKQLGLSGGGNFFW